MNQPANHSDEYSNIQPMVSITCAAYRKLLDCCADALPHEACGVLAAPVGSCNPGENLIIDAVYPIRNSAASTLAAFSFAPEDWVRAYYEITKNRQAIVGFYHSHPRTPPAPSPADTAGIQALNGGRRPFTYWIVSFAKPHCPEVQTYALTEGKLLPLMLAQISV